MPNYKMLLALFLLLGFCFHLTILGQQIPTTVSPSKFWKIFDMQNSIDNGDSHVFPILSNSRIPYTTYFGFYTTDNHSFILSVMLQGTVIWSANHDNPVGHNAILNFTREGDLVLHDNSTTSWSITATKSKSSSVVGMRLDASGNLMLFDKNNVSKWKSFDHPTDTLVMGQSLCKGKNLSAKASNSKWPSARVYLSADYSGLLYSLEPAGYTQVFQAAATTNSTPSICYVFVNGSFGFPDTKLFSLPSTTSPQFMRLEPDGHLRLYDLAPQERRSARMLYDVLSTVMDFCDYPLACGNYGVCSNGQCSCPSLSNFRFQDERLPGAGCIPLSNTSCGDANKDHKLVPLTNVSYFSNSLFQSLAISGSSETVCMQSCLTDCSCKGVIFQKYERDVDGGNCLLLSEKKIILFAAQLHRWLSYQ